MGGDNVVRFPAGTRSLATLARHLYDALRHHAETHAQMSELLSDMLKYKTDDRVVKDLVILMIMIHRDRKDSK